VSIHFKKKFIFRIIFNVPQISRDSQQHSLQNLKTVQGLTKNKINLTIDKIILNQKEERINQLKLSLV
jgi:hypothetical protein